MLESETLRLEDVEAAVRDRESMVQHMDDLVARACGAGKSGVERYHNGRFDQLLTLLSAPAPPAPPRRAVVSAGEGGEGLLRVVRLRWWFEFGSSTLCASVVLEPELCGADCLQHVRSASLLMADEAVVTDSFCAIRRAHTSVACVATAHFTEIPALGCDVFVAIGYGDGIDHVASFRVYPRDLHDASPRGNAPPGLCAPGEGGFSAGDPGEGLLEDRPPCRYSLQYAFRGGDALMTVKSLRYAATTLLGLLPSKEDQQRGRGVYGAAPGQGDLVLIVLEAQGLVICRSTSLHFAHNALKVVRAALPGNVAMYPSVQNSVCPHALLHLSRDLKEEALLTLRHLEKDSAFEPAPPSISPSPSLFDQQVRVDQHLSSMDSLFCKRCVP
mmetsp:Transcript_35581/g.100176  ORF Transcript_35581/g.100176 Transcript_35581/m.100176 type:complete len:386 (+) Transcript_35581:20-1177(+)